MVAAILVSFHMKTIVVMMVACVLGATLAEAKTDVTKQPFGKMPDGTPVEIYTLNDAQIEVRIMTYGGIVVSLKAPDLNGKLDDIVLGFDDLDGYVANNNSQSIFFFGALIGRYANRIAHGTFTLDGKKYSVPRNNGENSLHGGPHGFYNVVWNAKQIASGVELTYLSKDGEEGYPGNLTVTVRYILAQGMLRIEYLATTDKPTVVNLTHHSYFNLAGQGNGDILDHQLTLNASKFTPVNASQIPTGELKSVASTPFDFRQPTRIGERIDANDQQIKLGQGYDHNWVIDGPSGSLHEAAELYEAKTGRVLKVLTTEPGIQFYSGNFLADSLRGKAGRFYSRRSGLCLETQHFPDSPNHPDFPSTELKPGHTFESITVYSFSTR
jgi:aldose 1-epimerase